MRNVQTAKRLRQKKVSHKLSTDFDEDWVVFRDVALQRLTWRCILSQRTVLSWRDLHQTMQVWHQDWLLKTLQEQIVLQSREDVEEIELTLVSQDSRSHGTWRAFCHQTTVKNVNQTKTSVKIKWQRRKVKVRNEEVWGTFPSRKCD